MNSCSHPSANGASCHGCGLPFSTIIAALESENKALRKTNALARKHWTECLTKVEQAGQKRHFLGRQLKQREEENQELRAENARLLAKTKETK